MLQIQLNTDCEGPLALNDNAFELCREFIKPHGDRFFTQVSRYADYLADIAKKPEYQAGDHPEAHPAVSQGPRPDQRHDPGFFRPKPSGCCPGRWRPISFCTVSAFPSSRSAPATASLPRPWGAGWGLMQEHIFGTELDLDRYNLAPAEAEELRRLEEEIVAAPAIELPAGAGALTELPEPVQEAIARLDRIFWERLPQMEIGAIYREVKPVGGAEKAKAVADSLSQTGLKMEDTIYVGDSQHRRPGL